MKYRFAVQQKDEKENEPEPRRNLIDEYRWDAVFTAEINADEMVELMQHLWTIADKRK